MKAVCLLVVILFSGLLIPASGCSSSTNMETGILKAAIVDQLDIRQPNPDFIAQSKKILESFGLQVDVWRGSQVTVDFYRNLPSMGYRFILLRVHSGTLMELKGNQTVELPDTYLFTAENYTSKRYAADQLSDKVSYAVMDENTSEVFAVNSKFVRDSKGSFNRTIILSMGCESFRHTDLEQAFMAKGASIYIGWSDVVTLDHVDRVTLQLIRDYFSGGMTIQQGIADISQQIGPDPYFGSYLKFSPETSGTRTMKELLE